MQSNDLSFSIPKWHKEEIKSLTFAEEEIFYMSSPYNLSDFKTEIPSLHYIFSPNEEISELPNYPTKRQLNPAVKKQIAIFVVFLWEIILSDYCNNIQNSANTGTRPSITSLQWLQPQNGMVNILKKPIYLLNLCKLTQIPKKFTSYYKNQIIKKILFQYIGKCMYNISLIQLLLLNNEMLQFSVELFVKSVVSDNRPIAKFNEQLTFNEQTKFFVKFFEHSTDTIRSTNNLLEEYLTFDQNELRTKHFLLKNNNGKFYLYKNRIQSAAQKRSQIQSLQETTMNKIEKLIQKQQNKAKPQQSIRQHNQDDFLSCFSCFRR